MKLLDYLKLLVNYYLKLLELVKCDPKEFEGIAVRASGDPDMETFLIWVKNNLTQGAPSLQVGLTLTWVREHRGTR